MNLDIKININLHVLECTRCGNAVGYSDEDYTEDVFCTNCYDAFAEVMSY